MDTRALEKFARSARRQLHEQVAARLERVLRTDSAELREHAAAVQKLKDEIKETSREAVVERVAYTWFNRFCALRFMDVNHYTALGVVSPAEGFTQPELLQEAKQGHIDDALPVDRQRVFDLLSGQLPAREPQQEAYRLLLVATCNAYHGAMPYLFEPIADYTELLIPDDLLSEGSILQAVRAALTVDACQDEEVIGWLYQYYIGEKKEAVDEKVKAGGKVAADELPAKTSLYTPDWIVRFLVENSLGRLWLLNRPQSKLAERMAYCIRPEQALTDYVRVASPEELRVGDSAVGSGHMLLYAFDLLYAIYEEEGYNPPDIPRLILTQNLYGMEIDPRSAALAAFALTMKARRKDRRFLRRAETQAVRPNICVLHSVHFTAAELAATPWLAKLGATLIDLPVQETLLHDLQAAARLDNVGSLLRPQLTLAQIERVRAAVGAADDLFTHEFNERVLDVLAQVEYLARRYYVVVANPPYLGKGMNEALGGFAQQEYPDSKADMFAMFMERNLDLAAQGGLVAMITMQSWMFLSSYEKLREKLLDRQTLLAMAHLGAKAFDSIGGEVVSTTAFVVERAHRPEFKGSYVRLVDGNNEAEKEAALRLAMSGSLYRASAADFKKIPGAPIAYWLTEEALAAFEGPRLEEFAVSAGRCKTHDDERFVRFHWEIRLDDVGPAKKWKMLSHGGEFRRWYGNRDRVFDWTDNARYIYSQHGGLSQSRYWNTPAISWSDISSKPIAARLKPGDSENSSLAPTLIPISDDHISAILGYLNSRSANWFLAAVNSTFHSNPGDVLKLPYRSISSVHRMIDDLVSRSKLDWDAYETSWDFTDLPLLRREHRGATLAATYASLRSHGQAMTDEMQRLEEENNRIFIDAYGLQDELTPHVPLHEITLTCNPHYRYGAGKTDAEYEALLLADTMRELVSYAVGCMFGRYSLDKPGLILANQGETEADYRRIVAAQREVPSQASPDQSPDREGGQPSQGPASSLTVAAQIAEAPATYQPIPLAYFITFHTYGTWLPGDVDGSVDHAHNAFGAPTLPPDPGREAQARERMDQPAYTLDAARQAIVLQAIQEVCAYRGWSLLAVHVRTNHAHIVVYSNQAPERVMTDFKAYASRKLNAGGFDAPECKRWTRHGSTRYLWHTKHVEAAIRYVVHEQGEAMAVYENTERAVSQPPVATGGALKETQEEYVALVPVDELPMFQIEDVDPPDQPSPDRLPSPDREGGQLSPGTASSLTVAAQTGACSSGGPYPSPDRPSPDRYPSPDREGGQPSQASSLTVAARTITFPPDRDNVLPILDGEWFEDDIVDRFKRFLRVTFGEAHYTENLDFIERALGRDLRSYFLREFYDDHVKRYQKRPIYWLFSSPKGSFNALIYMHRYRPDTVSVVLNEYLRNFHSKLVAHKRHLEQVSISASATPRDKTAALREIDRLGKVIAELTAYENEVLYPLATQQVAIDLDDGVKVNYGKLGKALRKIVGVSA